MSVFKPKTVITDAYGDISVPSAERAYAHAILRGLNRTKSPGEMYQGTANPKTVARRRSKNKVARVSRKGNHR